MEELNPSEISQIIKQKIDALDSEPKPGNEELLSSWQTVLQGFTASVRS